MCECEGTELNEPINQSYLLLYIYILIKVIINHLLYSETHIEQIS